MDQHKKKNEKKLSKKQKKELKRQEKQLIKQQQVAPQPNSNKSMKQSKQFPASSQSKKLHKEEKKQKQHHIQENENDEEEQVVDELDLNQVLDQENIEEIQNQQVSFLISEINEKHYHSMKIILQKFARMSGVTSSQWADAIITNAKAGNVAVIDDDSDEEEQEQQQQDQNEIDDEEDVVNSVLNLLPCTNKLTKKLQQKFIQSYDKWGRKNPNLIAALRQSSNSLLICQRAINLPAFVAVSMHQVLAGELKQSKKQNPQAFKKSFGKYIMGMSEVQIPKGVKNPTRQQLIYSRFEDYSFMQRSQEWWIGQNSPNSMKKVDLKKLYFVINIDKYLQAAESLSELLNQGE